MTWEDSSRNQHSSRATGDQQCGRLGDWQEVEKRERRILSALYANLLSKLRMPPSGAAAAAGGAGVGFFFFYTEGGAKKSEPRQSYCTWKHWQGAMSDFCRQMERVGRDARREGESTEPGNQRALGWNLVATWVVWVSSVHVGFTARLSFRGRESFTVCLVGWLVVCEHG